MRAGTLIWGADTCSAHGPVPRLSSLRSTLPHERLSPLLGRIVLSGFGRPRHACAPAGTKNALLSPLQAERLRRPFQESARRDSEPLTPYGQNLSQRCRLPADVRMEIESKPQRGWD